MGYRDGRATLGDAPPAPPDPSDSDGLLTWIRQQTADFRALGSQIQTQAQQAKLAQGYAIQNGDPDAATQFAQLSADAADNYNAWNNARNALDALNNGLATIGLPGLGIVPYIIGGVVLVVLATAMYAVYQHFDDAQQQLDALKAGKLTGQQYAAVTAGGGGGVGSAVAGVVVPLALVAGAIFFLPQIADKLGAAAKRIKR
jgi:hypothetical protein